MADEQTQVHEREDDVADVVGGPDPPVVQDEAGEHDGRPVQLEAGADGEAAFYEAKLATARFFMERMLPETAAHLARIESGADSIMALPEEAF